PEHPVRAGGMQVRGDGRTCLPRPLHRALPRGRPRYRDRLDGEVLADRPAGQDHRPLPAAVRRLRLYGGIPDIAHVPGCAGDAYLRRDQRDHEAADRAQPIKGSVDRRGGEPMPDAFIYDHVRTPRGRGKADGSLHEVTALNLAAQALAAVKARNNLDPALVDDVVLGCVDPIGEAGGDIARVAALTAGYGNGVPAVPIIRFCASGLDAVNFAAAEIMSGQHDMTIGGGVESMSRVGIGASGGAWAVDPSIALPAYFMPQGISADLIATKYGFSRDDVDAYAVESQKRAATAWQEGRFARSVVAVKDINGLTLLAKDEHMRPGTTMQSLAQLNPSFVQIGDKGGFDAVAVQAHPE